MGSRWFILIFFFTSINIHFTQSKFAFEEKSEYFRDNFFANTTFYLINPSQFNEAEKIVQTFLSKLVEPIGNDVISRRQMEPKNLDSLIQAIPSTIRQKLMEVAKEYGLRKTYERYEKSLHLRRDRPTENWYPETLLQGFFLLSDVVGMIDESTTLMNSYFNRRNIAVCDFFKSTPIENQWSEIKIFNNIGREVKLFSNVFKCIHAVDQEKKTDNREELFSLSRVLKNLTTSPPEINVKNFKNQFRSPIPEELVNKNDSDDQVQKIFCHFATQREQWHYEKCMDEFNRINECTYKPETHVRKSRKIRAKPWLEAVADLSDCKAIINDKREAIIVCPLEKENRNPNTEEQLKFVYRKLLRIKIHLPQRMLKNLAKNLGKSEIGKRIVNEIYQFVRIYCEGQKKVNRFSKMAQRDEKYLPMYRKVSKSFQQYRSGIFLKIMITVRDIHDCIYAFEEFAVNVDPDLHEDWVNYLGVFESIADWMTCLLTLLGISDTDESDVVEIIPDSTATPEFGMEEDLSLEEKREREKKNIKNDRDFNEYHGDYYKTGALQIVVSRNLHGSRKSMDEAFGKVLKKMDRASKGRLTKTTSALTTVMNNILLTTMFVETVGLVSALFALNQPTTAQAENSGIPEEAETETEEGDYGDNDYDCEDET